MNRAMPLIKEYRINKLTECLKCIDKFAYHREQQRDCVLELYPNKTQKSLEHREKSIFRGMVIPSLRYLGLIIGFGDMIKPSANGKLIIESQFDNDLHKRCWRAIVYEVDMKVFGFLTNIEHRNILKEKFIAILSERMSGVSDKQKEERFKKWLSILRQVELVEYLQDVAINRKKIEQTLVDINPDHKDYDKFCEYLINGYYKLSRRSAGIVDIRELRAFVATQFLKKNHEILTENQFDYLFRKFISNTRDFHISLGEPMGADQKLFGYKNKFYKTIMMKKKEVLK